jgi:hypothetical protein
VTKQETAYVILDSASFPIHGWSLTEIASPKDESTRLQLDGWLPHEMKLNGPEVANMTGERNLVTAELPGKHAHFSILDARVNVEVRGVGADQLFIKISWPHRDDQ